MVTAYLRCTDAIDSTGEIICVGDSVRLDSDDRNILCIAVQLGMQFYLADDKGLELLGKIRDFDTVDMTII